MLGCIKGPTVGGNQEKNWWNSSIEHHAPGSLLSLRLGWDDGVFLNLNHPHGQVDAVQAQLGMRD